MKYNKNKKYATIVRNTEDKLKAEAMIEDLPQKVDPIFIDMKDVDCVVLKADIYSLRGWKYAGETYHSLASMLIIKFVDNFISATSLSSIESRAGWKTLRMMLGLDKDLSHPFSILGMLLNIENESGMSYVGQRPGKDASDTGVFQMVKSTYAAVKAQAGRTDSVFGHRLERSFFDTLKNTIVEPRDSKSKSRRRFEPNASVTSYLDARDIFFQTQLALVNFSYFFRLIKKGSKSMSAFLLSEPVLGWGSLYATIDVTEDNGKFQDKKWFRDAVYERFYNSMSGAYLAGSSFNYSDLIGAAQTMDATAEAMKYVNKSNYYPFTQNYSSMVEGAVPGAQVPNGRGYLDFKPFPYSKGWTYTGNPFRLLLIALKQPSKLSARKWMPLETYKTLVQFVSGDLPSSSNKRTRYDDTPLGSSSVPGTLPRVTLSDVRLESIQRRE
jgi:hypothetical protein